MGLFSKLFKNNIHDQVHLTDEEKGENKDEFLQPAYSVLNSIKLYDKKASLKICLGKAGVDPESIENVLNEEDDKQMFNAAIRQIDQRFIKNRSPIDLCTGEAERTKYRMLVKFLGKTIQKDEFFEQFALYFILKLGSILNWNPRSTNVDDDVEMLLNYNFSIDSETSWYRHFDPQLFACFLFFYEKSQKLLSQIVKVGEEFILLNIGTEDKKTVHGSLYDYLGHDRFLSLYEKTLKSAISNGKFTFSNLMISEPLEKEERFNHGRYDYTEMELIYGNTYRFSADKDGKSIEEDIERIKECILDSADVQSNVKELKLEASRIDLNKDTCFAFKQFTPTGKTPKYPYEGKFYSYQDDDLQMDFSLLVEYDNKTEIGKFTYTQFDRDAIIRIKGKSAGNSLSVIFLSIDDTRIV